MVYRLIHKFIDDDETMQAGRDDELMREQWMGEVHIQPMIGIKSDATDPGEAYRFRAADLDHDPLVR